MVKDETAGAKRRNGVFMGKLDEVLAKAKDLAKVAGNKTEEVVELTRLKIQASQLRGDIDANYLKLGEIIYELNKAGTENEELISMCIAEIESQRTELAELTNRIDEMKNVVKCSECLAANPVGALYCARCGARLEKKQEQEAPTEQETETAQAEEADAAKADEAPAQLESAEKAEDAQA